MMRPTTTVARRATETVRARASRPRTEHRRPNVHEIIRPIDLGLGQLFTLTREAVVVGDLDSARIALWSPGAERLLGWSAAEAVGLPLERLLPPPVLRIQRASIDLERRSGQFGRPEAQRPLDMTVLNMRGEEVRVELVLATLDHPPRQGRYVLALLRDTADRRLAELRDQETARIDSARVQAEQRTRRVSRLVQDAVADFGRDVRRLRRSAQRLNRDGSLPSPDHVRDLARLIDARSERIERHIEAIGASVAVASNTLELDLARVNLVPLVNQVVARNRARGIPHKLTVALPQGLTALVDARRVEQVIGALLHQACARNPRGCWIDIDLRRPLVGLARIEIREFGRPAPERMRQRLLTGADRDLALVRSIVELHGGTLGFEFPADGGVRAIVTLPTQRGRVQTGAA